MGFFRALFSQFGTSSGPTSIPTTCPECRRGGLEQGPEAFRCPTCEGLWIPRVVFSMLVERADNRIETAEAPPGIHTFSESQSPRACACCGLPMSNYQFEETSGTWIDACSDGHGVWLDAGELELLRRFHHGPEDAGEAVIEVEEMDPYRAAFLRSLSKSVEL